MKCEVEFLAVGDASRAGDAIIVRYGEVNSFKLMVIDGGTADTGEKLVTHLKTHFGQGVVLEHVVLTHSDADHASGLREVLRTISVKNIWLHIPWWLCSEAIHLFSDKRWTQNGLSAEIKKEYSIIAELVELAQAQHCNIFCPFAGAQIGPFTVLSPGEYHYLHLLPQFDKTPDPDQNAIEAANMWIGKASSNIFEKMFQKAAARVQNWITESWINERLKDGGVTSASNESSVTLYADIGNNQRLLLTGDAGINALWWSVYKAKELGFTLQNFSFVQIPHHGSRRNVGPTVLNALLGPIEAMPSNKFSAFVSAPADDADHPRKIVLNAFMRRGGRVVATQGTNKVYWGGFPPRGGYTSAEEIQFSPKVEDYS